MNRSYELVLMLDPEAADADRERVAGDVRQQIEGTGTLDRADEWGVRQMAYEIRQRNEADYRFYRFHGEPELLERLDHSLKITDGVLRFRIFKVDPESPANPPPPVERLAVASDRPDRERRGRRDNRDD
ncbi:MAG: small subunit ribosomal protein [Solirubrobacterales bacterium]|nr:small subunit ribosomal protein [Solirubrobacterales bacterium]